MMKKVWKNRSAVSPVIATILMVAITVVLAAVLYVMVMGFNNPGNNTPTGTLQATKGTATTTLASYTITLISISKNDVNSADCRLVLTPTTAGYTAGPLNQTGSVTGKVVAGDYVVADRLAVGTSYTATLQYIPTGNNVATITFVA